MSSRREEAVKGQPGRRAERLAARRHPSLRLVQEPGGLAATCANGWGTRSPMEKRRERERLVTCPSATLAAPNDVTLKLKVFVNKQHWDHQTNKRKYYLDGQHLLLLRKLRRKRKNLVRIVHFIIRKKQTLFFN